MNQYRLILIKLSVCLLVATLNGSGGASDLTAQVSPTSVTKWREDLRYLAKELPRKHGDAFHSISREKFEAAVAELDSAIPTLQDPEIILRLQQIMALVGDGHTSLADFPPATFRWYPVALYWFGKDLRVIGTTTTNRQALGAKVVRIRDVSVAAVATSVELFIVSGQRTMGSICWDKLYTVGRNIVYAQDFY